MTTEQIKNAPRDAYFVWCNSDLFYPKRLALMLQRDDLKIVTPRFLESNNWRGLKLSVEIIVDHAAELTPMQKENYAAIIMSIKIYANSIKGKSK